MNRCEELHKIVAQGKRFDVDSKEEEFPKNGIYIMFEKDEKAHGGERIVRIGTHTGKDRLPKRIKDHYKEERKDRSIFRKNIGRCFLNKEQNEYLKIWNYDLTPKANKFCFTQRAK